MGNINIVRQLDEHIWREFVDKNPHGQIFHLPEMFTVFECTVGYCPALWAAVDNNHRLLALMLPVEITLKNGLLRKLTTRAIVYGSVLYTPDQDGEKALGILLRAYNRENRGRFLFTELRNFSDLSRLQPVLAENGFIYEKEINYLIYLNRPAEEILQSIGRRTRKRIRKGLRDKIVHISEVTNRSELDTWYDTLKKTFRKAKVPLVDCSLFEAVFDELSPKGMAKFLIATIKGIDVSCSLELVYKDIIYGWFGGVDRDYSEYFPNEILIWYILEWGANNNYRVYDFGGAGKPDEEYGVRDFKAKFGGELVCYGRNMSIHSPFILKISKLGYAIYHRFL